MLDTLVLSFNGQRLRDFPIRGDRSLEIGAGSFCDIVVHDPDLAERAFWLEPIASGRIFARPFDDPASKRELRCGSTLRLGRFHSLQLLRRESPEGGNLPRTTEPIVGGDARARKLTLQLPDGRHIKLHRRALTVGTAQDNDVVLLDRSVSGRHCRFIPQGGSAMVRDLGSRNGTWLDGRRVHAADVRPGTLLRLGRTDIRILTSPEGQTHHTGLVAASDSMKSLLGEVERFSRLPWPVLVTGESGAGKEGIARALHQCGPRATKPFVALNAGGLPAGTVESELFGHERGAFTGAAQAHAGVFEQADGGTLFLDEIGELPLELQARLLRVLETWEVRRVGAESCRQVDVRLVCATHRDLRAMVTSGRFREDLFYRVQRLVVHVPPLRERLEDIVPLAEHFLRSAAQDVGLRRLGSDALAHVLSHRWPGNARELRNVVCAAAALSPGEVITANDLHRVMGRLGTLSDTNQSGLQEVVDRYYDGNLTAAARALGLPRTTLRDRLRRRKAR